MAKMKNILKGIISEAGPGQDSAYEAVSTIFSSMAQNAKNIAGSSESDYRTFSKLEKMALEGKVSAADIRWINQRVTSLKIAAGQMEKRMKMAEKYLMDISKNK